MNQIKATIVRCEVYSSYVHSAPSLAKRASTICSSFEGSIIGLLPWGAVFRQLFCRGVRLVATAVSAMCVAIPHCTLGEHALIREDSVIAVLLDSRNPICSFDATFDRKMSRSLYVCLLDDESRPQACILELLLGTIKCVLTIRERHYLTRDQRKEQLFICRQNLDSLEFYILLLQKSVMAFVGVFVLIRVW